MISVKDQKTLVSKINTPLLDFSCARVIVKNATPSLCKFYELNASKIDAKVIVVRSKSDEGKAASLRNSDNQVLFVFSENYWTVPEYFAGVCKTIELPKALLKRVK
tara:strand:+ start:2197 stop:2514 length:318 start_codon:yes stop_codon:yes gene_type:complete